MPKSFAAAESGEETDVPSDSKFDKLGLDVRTLTKELAKQLGTTATTGVVIAGVEEKSVAALAGLKSADLIEKVAGQPITTAEEYEKAKAQSSKADGLVLNVRSTNGKKFFVVLKVE